MLLGCHSSALFRGPGSAEAKSSQITEVFSGKNEVDETCQVYLAPEKTESDVQLYKVYCGRWKHSSGRIYQIGSPRLGADLEQWAKESWWRTRLGRRAICVQEKKGTILDKIDAIFLRCTLRSGGWPFAALVARVDGSLYLADGIPAVLGILEESIGVLSGRGDVMEAIGLGFPSKRVLEVMLSDRLYGAGDLRTYYRSMLLGQHYNGVKDFAAAEYRYREALAIHVKRLGENNPEGLDPLMHIALELSNQKRFDEADVLFAKVDTGVQRAPDRADYARYLSYKAIHVANRGQLEQAIELAREATELRRGQITQWNKFAGGIVDHTTQSGAAASSRAIPDILSNSWSPNAADVVQSLYIEAAMELYRGDSSRAEQAYQEAKATLLASNEAPLWWEPLVEGLGGRIAGAREVAGTREARLSEAIELWNLRVPEERPGALDYLELGKLYQADGRLDEAMEAFRTGTALVRDLRGSLRFEQLNPYFEAALALAVARPEEQDRLYAEIFEAAQLVRSGRTSQDIARVSARLAVSEQQPGAASRQPRVKLIRKLQDAQDERYFQYREFAEEKFWLDKQITDQASREDIDRLGKRDADAEQRRQSLDDLAHNTVMDKGRLEQLINQDIELNREIEALEKQVQHAFPGYNQLIDKVVDADKIVQLLDPDEALVQILLGDSESMLFTVRGGNIGAYRLDVSRADADAAVKKLRSSIVEPKVNFDVAAAHRLYQRLLSPIADQIPEIDHLIVVPQGPLTSLPFGVLVTSAPSLPGRSVLEDDPVSSRGAKPHGQVPLPSAKTSEPDYSGVQWLVQENIISLVPSVRSFVFLRSTQPSQAVNTLLGFGYPVPFKKTVLQKVKPGDFNLPSECSSDAKLLGEHINDLVGLSDLPGTKRELHSVTSMIPAPKRVFLGREFTENRVKSYPLQDFRILFFASHTFLPTSEKCVSEPALVTSLVDPPQKGEDGLIDAREILKFELDADLVVLSACDTGGAGAEKELRGESLSGLARSFFFAGARSLLVSHWKVPDEETADLMIALFRNAKTEDLTKALGTAQQKLISDPSTAHPFFWAAFTVVGDGKRAVSLKY